MLGDWSAEELAALNESGAALQRELSRMMQARGEDPVVALYGATMFAASMAVMCGANRYSFYCEMGKLMDYYAELKAQYEGSKEQNDI